MSNTTSGFRAGESQLKLFVGALGVGAFIALLIGIFTEEFLVFAGLVKELKEGEVADPTLSKLGEKLVVPVRVAMLAFAAVWALEIPHVGISVKTRRLFAEAEEGAKPFDVEGLKESEGLLLFYQFFLVFAVVGGFIGMMFVPSILKSGGVRAPAMAAITMMTWTLYLGPILFCAFRFHHVGVTRDTRLRMIALADRLGQGASPSESAGDSVGLTPEKPVSTSQETEAPAPS